ncbi:MAG TPA: glucose-6-phosphate dehydrogenase [bacterium]
MSELFKNKYRIHSIRLPGWDYRSPGGYFVTICTKDRECWFGEIDNGEMILSDLGKIVDQYWQEIPDHFKNVQPDEFVIMPNHTHGILFLMEFDQTHNCRDVACNVSTIV